MSDWRVDLRRVTIGGKQFVGASFRGVPFFVSTSERSGGRRVVTHEFPLRAKPFVEDLDARAKKFRVDGFVIGDDYLVQRDALLTVLEDTAGPGQLVHPYYGTLSAIADTVSVRESTADGGMATLAIDFVATPAQEATPVIATDLAGKVSSAADDALLANDAQLAASYNVVGLADFAVASSRTALTAAADGLAARLGPVVKNADELAALNGQLTLLVAQATALVRTPALVTGALVDALKSLETTAADAPSELLSALVDSYSFDLGSPPDATTSTRAREAVNQRAFTSALRSVVAIAAARIAPSVPYATLEDALAARDQVAGILDTESALCGDIAFPGLVNLRAAVLKAVPGEASYPRVVPVTRRVAVHTLVLAYQLYGSVDLEADIIARNRVVNPSFVFGALQVLSDV